MNKLCLIILLLTSHSFVQAQDMSSMDMKKKTVTARQKVTYTCVMHPEIHASKPGNCPKCGMKLIKEKAKKLQPAASISTNDSLTEMNMGDSTMDGMGDSVDSSMIEVLKAQDSLDELIRLETKLAQTNAIENNTPPHTVRYDLFVADTIVHYAGQLKRAIAVNGLIPMPTLTFTEGDTAEIYVHNNLKEGTTLHWHGLFLPNQYDGVANLTQMPIAPKATFLYRFPIIQHGTHWYHSHDGLQEQIGLYGAFVINKRKEWEIPTIPIIISEWSDTKPKEIDRMLHTGSDWFSIQKGAVQSYKDAVQNDKFQAKLTSEWKRMKAMDVSDIYYDKILVNGQNEMVQPQFKAGDKVRLRIANAGASDYFWLTYSGGKITVIASDGNDVEPVVVDRLLIAVSETYDVIVTVPENKSYQFLVTPEDRTKFASLWLGTGEKIAALPLPPLNYFAGMEMMNNMMNMKGNMVEMKGMKMEDQRMDMNTVMYPEIINLENNSAFRKADNMQSMAIENKIKRSAMQRLIDADNKSLNIKDTIKVKPPIITLNYAMLRATEKTNLPAGPVKELKFNLTGNMNRYVWTLDDKTVSESDKILIKKGENVRIILYNNSMMRHPMHLHGHDFRILNGQGDYAPLKNVLDMMPMERDTIEFAANENGGDWFFHCHILYHMMSGMGRIFSYENSPANPAIPDAKKAQEMLFADDKMFYAMAKVGLESNGSDGNVQIANTRWHASTMWHLGLHDSRGYESETMLGRYLGKMQWWFPYVGFDYHYKAIQTSRYGTAEKDKNWFGQTSNKDNRKTIVAGVAYTLPMLFIADLRIDGNGKLRFQLGREDVALTDRLRFNIMFNTDKEFTTGIRYIVSKNFSVSSHYDSDMGLGAGITLVY